MLPITHGEGYTRRQILYYVIALVVASILPVVIGMSGILYLTCTTLLGTVFLYFAIVLVREQKDAPIRTFRYSIVYLAGLFVVMLVDHLLANS